MPAAHTRQDRDVAKSRRTSLRHRLPRRRWIVGMAVVVAVCVAGLAGRSWLEGRIRNHVLPGLASQLGQEFEVGEIEFGFGTATLRDIKVHRQDGEGPLARVRQATVSVDLGALFHGDVVVKHVALSGVSANLTIGDDELSARLRMLLNAKSSSAAIQREGSRFSKTTLSATDVVVKVEELASGSNALLHASRMDVDSARVLTMTGVDLTASGKLRGQTTTIELSDARVRATKAGALSVSAGKLQAASSDSRLQRLLAESSVETMYAERVRGQSGRWEYHVMGNLTPSKLALDDTSESFLLTLSKTASGKDELRVHANTLKLARFTSLLPRPEIGLEGARASVDWAILADQNTISLHGETILDGLRIEHTHLAKGPVYFKDTILRGHAVLNRQTGAFRINDATLVSGDVPYEFSLGMSLPGLVRGDHHFTRLAASVAMPKVSCSSALASLPQGFAPELEGFALSGTTEGELSVSIDWDNLDATELHSTVNFDECQVDSAPFHMSAERLGGSFEHRVPVPEGWRTFVVGPENSDYVPLRKVSKNLTRTFLTTEDSGFYRHSGFITKEFQSALIKNLKRGRFAYGASSISMQVVKNVLLSREKTVSRKVQELFLTWHMERILSKDRILEIYVNAIEFGPGLYGIGPAAGQYFSKKPSRLNPVESAFLSSLLPAPTRRFRQYCRGRIRRSTGAKIERILGHMHKRHRLDEEAHAIALETQLSFRGRKSALCKNQKPKKKSKTS